MTEKDLGLDISACITKYVGTYYNYESNIELLEALRDSLSRGQLLSKLEAVRITQAHFDQFLDGFFIGHWHGLLPLMFRESGLIVKGYGVELDPFWVYFSNKLNWNWPWHSKYADVNDCEWPSTGIVINTSCEHMTDEWIQRVPRGTVVCAQSTDYQHPTHINTVASLDEFLSKWTEYTVIDSSSIVYDVYSRFTMLAIKN